MSYIAKACENEKNEKMHLPLFLGQKLDKNAKIFSGIHLIGLMTNDLLKFITAKPVENTNPQCNAEKSF